MRVADLLDMLSEVNPEAELRIGYQPSYPLWLSVDALSCPPAEADEADEADEEEPYDAPAPSPEDAEIIYLLAGESDGGYASSDLWEHEL